MNAQAVRPLEQIECCRDIPEKHAKVDLSEGIELPNGLFLDGRFIIGEPLSRGGMATIYLAQDTLDDGRTMAIKVPLARYSRDPGYVARFKREEEIGLKLDHPALLKCIPVPQRTNRLYLVTEYLSGCTLAHLQHKRRPLPEADALKIASLVCDALQYLHAQGIIHRDLKPDNIMLCRDHTIRIMDFGLATPIRRSFDVLADWVPIFGTPQYMAPEQVKRSRNDERTDLYSLGVILYEMLTGKLPFIHDDPWVAAQSRVRGDPKAPRDLNPALSSAVEEIVLHAMQRKPAARYPNAATFKADLDAPEKVRITGYRDHLRPPRWVLSVEQAQLISGLALGVGILLSLVVGFFMLVHFQHHK